MTDRLRIALAQFNPKVGAVGANLALARTGYAQARDAGADIVLFPELFLTGYFPEDLLFRPAFVADAIEAAKTLAAETAGSGTVLVLPTVWRENDTLHNALIVAEDGQIVAVRFKRELPNDDVFYEKRYFEPGPLPDPVTIKGVVIGLPICEDIWHKDVCARLRARGAELMLCPNGSPYWRRKQAKRKALVEARVAEDGVPMLYLNQVGGQDELVYDGASFALEPGGALVLQARSFVPELLVSDWERRPEGWRCETPKVVPRPSQEELAWQACVLALRDYAGKNGFTHAVLNLSGGIDSALVAAMAVDAFGPQNLHCIMQPYHYTSQASLSDAAECARLLGVRYDIVPIAGMVEAGLEALSPLFAGRQEDLTEENIQSRIRGTLLMAVSNKFGGLPLTTGNKSEMAVGYATIYGDMNGGYNPIKDLFKMEVYALSAWRNAHHPHGALGPSGTVIPQAIIDKAPSAELRPDQTDQQSLPPYPVLDAILKGLIEEERSVAEIVAEGFEPDLVKRVERLALVSEYKRRQSAPGVKLTEKAFGIGRKYPITNGYSSAARPGR